MAKRSTAVWVLGGGSLHNPPSDIVSEEMKWLIAWKTLKRWQRRIGKIAAAQTDPDGSWDMVDFVHVFILLSFQLRDWLVESRRCTKKEVLAFFDKTIELQVCRDIANGLKHLVLRNPSISSELGLHREYDYDTGGDVYKITFFIGQQKHDWEVLEFAAECMGKWEQFLSRRGLIKESGHGG